jgi:hypothetical protein
MRLDLAAEELRKKMGPYETEVISQRRIINNRDVTDRAMLRTVAKQPVRPELAQPPRPLGRLSCPPRCTASRNDADILYTAGFTLYMVTII